MSAFAGCGHLVAHALGSYGPSLCENSTRYKRTLNFEACGRAQSKPGADGWKRILRGADVIYHLAWSTVPSEASRAPIEDARVNIVGSLSLIQAMQEAPS
jgi:nucleoside-diphosphate-sugar epimerase